MSDGDFVLPSVGAEDAAWGFGFHYEGMHRDEDVRAGFSRDGYLLTASGIGLGNLAAPMIWSADGRYLALTRHVQRYEESELERDQWRLLLLDVQERTLRRYRDDLGSTRASTASTTTCASAARGRGATCWPWTRC